MSKKGVLILTILAKSSCRIIIRVGGVALHTSDPEDDECHTPGACLTKSDCFSVAGVSLALPRLRPLLLAGTSFAAPCLFGSLPRLFCPHVFPYFFLGFIKKLVRDGHFLRRKCVQACFQLLLSVLQRLLLPDWEVLLVHFHTESPFHMQSSRTAFLGIL